MRHRSLFFAFGHEITNFRNNTKSFVILQQRKKNPATTHDKKNLGVALGWGQPGLPVALGWGASAFILALGSQAPPPLPPEFS